MEAFALPPLLRPDAVDPASLTLDVETHSYHVDGIGIQSVTDFAKGVCGESFDPDDTLDKFYEGWQSDPKKNPKYFGRSREDIKAEWESSGKRAAELGVELHSAIEAAMRGDGGTELEKLAHRSACKSVADLGTACEEDAAVAKAARQAMDFCVNGWAQLGLDQEALELYACEWRVADLPHRIGGTVDLAVQTPDGFLLLDWKRSSTNLKPNAWSFRKFCKPPLGHLPLNRHNRCRVQMNLYRHLVETVTQENVSRMVLVQLNPTCETWNIVDIEYLDVAPILPVAREVRGSSSSMDGVPFSTGPTEAVDRAVVVAPEVLASTTV